MLKNEKPAQEEQQSVALRRLAQIGLQLNMEGQVPHLKEEISAPTVLLSKQSNLIHASKPVSLELNVPAYPFVRTAGGSCSF